MTREEQLKFCSFCKKRSFNPKFGIVCSLTDEMATFERTCPEYLEDENEVNLEEQKKIVDKSDVNKSINKGRYALFVIAGLYVIAGIYEAFLMLGHDIIFGIIDWFIAAVFIVFGFWSYKKASLALIIGLSFYLLLNILLAIVDVSTLFSGILWKIIIISALLYSIKTAREEEAKVKPVSEDLLDQI